jgi:spermidine/putrescine transport system substrate-binding protein
MRTLVLLVALLLAATLGAAELRIFNWAEYLPQDVIKQFEKEYQCKILLDTYEDPEAMIAKLKAGAVSAYDLVVPSGYHMRSMIEGGLLMKLDKTQLKNLGNLAPEFAHPDYDPEMGYSVPYQWGTAGLCYRRSEFSTAPTTWATIFTSGSAPGPFLLMDDMRETISAALFHLGHSINTTDPAHLAAAKNLLIKTKKRDDCLGFAGSVEATNRILAGDAVAAICFNGDVAQKQAEDDDITYIIPAQGGTRWVDNLCIPAKAPNAKLAHAFIDFTLRGPVAAAISNGNRYASPVAAADPHLDPALLGNPIVYPPEAVRAKLETILDLGADSAKYDALWTAVRAE